MLEVILYQTHHDMIKKAKTEAPLLIVCPSPTMADELRKLLPEFDILTISKWTNDHLKNLGLTRTRKSELMLKLGAIWHHYYPNEVSNIFYQAFELFTELRSYTLSLDLLSEFLKELEDTVSRSILIFWTYLEQEKLIDEHLSYQQITLSQTHKSTWFIGFKHMSGVQLDMLKTLSEEHEIKVSCPHEVFNASLPNDWIRWIKPDDAEATEEHSKIVKIHFLPRGKTNTVLEKFYRKYPSHNILLAGNNIGFLDYQESYYPESFLKSSEDIFKIELKKLIGKLKAISLLKSVSIEECDSYLEGSQQHSQKVGNYRAYKVEELTRLAFAEYSTLQVTMDSFAIDIVEMVVGLNLPRVSLVSLNETSHRQIFSAKDISFREEGQVAIVATENISQFSMNESVLTEAMTNALKVIGPIKRKGLEFLFQKLEMKELLKSSESFLFIEEALLSEDLAWREILKSFELDFVELDADYKAKKIQDFISPRQKLGPFQFDYHSASRLQVYQDCPQKFYFSYVEKIDHEPESRIQVSSSELGNLEHQIIGIYFDKVGVNVKDPINLELHRDISQTTFQEFLIQGRLILNESEKSKSLNEIMHYSLNGIMFLVEIMNEYRVKSIRFEIPLPKNSWNIKGFADCLIELENNKFILLDFKRSVAAIGTKKETLEFSKLQLWIYLLIFRQSGIEFDYFGYLNLSEPAEGSVCFQGTEASELMAISLPRVKDLISGLIKEIEMKTCFPPSPKNKKVCTYCVLRLTCSKGELIDC